jgi:hypothetical protein
MNMLVLNPTQQGELVSLNATGDPDRQLIANPLNTGDAALGADLLSDCAPGQTWEHYGDFLQTLPAQEISVSDLVEPQIA